MHFEAIGNVIRERRGVLRLTQAQLASLSGVALRTIKLIETGQGNPAVGTLLKLTDVLGLEITVQAQNVID